MDVVVPTRSVDQALTQTSATVMNSRVRDDKDDKDEDDKDKRR